MTSAALTVTGELHIVKLLFDNPIPYLNEHTTSISSFAQATGSALCTFVNATSTLLFSLFIGYYFGWKLALVVTLFMPLLILVGVLQVQMMAGYAKGGQRAVEQGGKVSGSDRSNLLARALVLRFTENKGRKHELIASVGQVCAEAIDKVRTVASLTKETFFQDKYNAISDELFK